MGQVLLHLVRHGRPQIQPGRAASTWPLDPSANTEEMHRLRSLLEDRAPTAAWFSSGEPKAVATARLLTTGPVRVLPTLREAHRSDWFETHEEFRAVVLDAFSRPDRPARPGWEPLDQTRRRISEAVVQLVGQESDDLVLVGHGTAWTLLISEITGREPDLNAWTRLRTPDLCILDLGTQTISHRWGRL